MADKNTSSLSSDDMQDKLKTLLMVAGAHTLDAVTRPQAQGAQAAPVQVASGGTPQQPPVQPVSQDPDPSSPPQGAAPSSQRLVQLSAMTRAPAGSRNPTADIQSELRDALEKSRAAQQGNIENDKLLAAAQLSKKQGVDFSPTYDTVRMLGGERTKNAGSGVSAPEDVSKEDAVAMGRLSKDQQVLTDDQTNQLKAELQNKLLGQSMQTQRMGLMQDRLNEQVYGKQVQGLRNDKVLNDLIGKNNSISRTADVLFAPGTEVNTTSLHDLQQTVTGALTGLSGGGGVGERAERYMTDMATDLAKLKQKFGDTDSVPRDEPILVHYLGLAKAGQEFLADQAQRRIHTLAGGHENVTELPTYAPMFHQQVDDIKGNLTKSKYFGAADAAQAAQAYDGSAPLPNGANAAMKAARVRFLQAKAGGQ